MARASAVWRRNRRLLTRLVHSGWLPRRHPTPSPCRYHLFLPWRWELWASLSNPNAGCCDEFRPYVDAVADRVSPALGATVNIGLVDGRFRVACALKLLDHVDPARHVVFVHDFLKHRAYYRPLLDYYDVLEWSDSLVALRRKPDLERAAGGDGGWRVGGRSLPGYEAFLDDPR